MISIIKLSEKQIVEVKWKMLIDGSVISLNDLLSIPSLKEITRVLPNGEAQWA